MMLYMLTNDLIYIHRTCTSLPKLERVQSFVYTIPFVQNRSSSVRYLNNLPTSHNAILRRAHRGTTHKNYLFAIARVHVLVIPPMHRVIILTRWVLHSTFGRRGYEIHIVAIPKHHSLKKSRYNLTSANSRVSWAKQWLNQWPHAMRTSQFHYVNFFFDIIKAYTPSKTVLRLLSTPIRKYSCFHGSMDSSSAQPLLTNHQTNVAKREAFEHQ